MTRFIVVVAATLTLSSPAFAQTEHDAEATSDAIETTYRYRPLVDVPVSVLATTITIGASLPDDETEGPSVRSVDSVFVLDRFVARSPETRSAARHASDAVLLSSVGLAAISSAFSLASSHAPRADRVRERFRRVGIFVETIALSSALTSVVKLGARRPRPFTYDPAYDPTTGSLDDQLSFFSGHSSTVAAASAAAAYFAFAESGRDARRFAILGAGTVATLSVAALRVRAAKHFPTDVSVGVIVGACVGVLVPHLHRRTGVSISAEPVAGGAVFGVAGAL